VGLLGAEVPQIVVEVLVDNVVGTLVEVAGMVVEVVVVGGGGGGDDELDVVTGTEADVVGIVLEVVTGTVVDVAGDVDVGPAPGWS
jgi:hypothetical protein